MNDTLRRALLRARLTEDDVAASLAVDPKTVRRWTEGRVPYLRHRWELARLLDCDETDLWPQFGAREPRPAEVLAIYPHRDGVPGEVWQGFFGSAEQEINILANTGLFLTRQPAVLNAIARRAERGVLVRICVSDPRATKVSNAVASRTEDALARYGPLRHYGSVEIRGTREVLTNSLCRADNGLMVGQFAVGVPPGETPVLHLHRTSTADIANTYLESFDRIWAESFPLE